MIVSDTTGSTKSLLLDRTWDKIRPTSPTALSPESGEGALRGPTAVLVFQFPLRPLGERFRRHGERGLTLGRETKR